MINLNSKISQKVLSYFLLNPEEEMYLNEIVRKFDVDKRNLAKAIKDWEKEGLFIKTTKGNLSLYKVNNKYFLLDELKGTVQKNFGIEKGLRSIFERNKEIKEAYIFGSYASNKMEAESDIDVLLVGSHNSLDIQREIINLEKNINREINIIDMTEEEFLDKKKNNEFIKNILKNQYIKII
ncbi:MAG: nucleotidyltransferase domain-containing protein [Bacteroidales bacterium]|nr:nucleotidyltransferase domain-containing protein [Bacteroidales bacterium]